MKKYLTFPNLFSFLRIVLSAIAIVAFFLDAITISLILLTIVVGILLDVGNGWLAKLLNKQSFVGKILDSIGDFLCFGILTGLLISIKAGILLALAFIFANFIREIRILKLKDVKLKGVPNTFIAFLVVVFSALGFESYLFWTILTVCSVILLSANLKIPFMHLRLYNLLKIKI